MHGAITLICLPMIKQQERTLKSVAILKDKHLIILSTAKVRYYFFRWLQQYFMVSNFYLPLIEVGLEVEQQPLLALMQTSQMILDSLKLLLVCECACVKKTHDMNNSNIANRFL